MKIDDEAYLKAAEEVFGLMFKKEAVDTRKQEEVEKAATSVAFIAKALKAALEQAPD